ncbi:hypothetical protein ISS05_02795 [Candidatus Woesearchaeota archaeon]|nr:hypothetical protein [Candidatus Woesearchaeota archaeon]
MTFKKIPKDIILPSAAMTISKKQLKFYKESNSLPQVGDVVYGKIERIGQHFRLENKEGRIHDIQDGSKAIFVFGNRYAPDFYEGIVPSKNLKEVDLLSRSGMIGIAKTKSSLVIDPTRISILGYVCDEDGNKINTKSYPLIIPNKEITKKPRSKMILVCGTSMNCGKSKAAAACVWALSSSGFKVRGSKITGTSGLKDILHMNDAGAKPVTDFSYLGYPSTYLIEKKEVEKIFNTLDLKHANNPKNFWVVEIADGLNQRETEMLLKSDEVKSRIHKLIFCASDAFGMIGGIKVLKDKFDLSPDALSGICSSSPLHVLEIKEYTKLPVFDSLSVNIQELNNLLTSRKTVRRNVNL